MARVSKPPDVRRQEILDTALLLFYEKGYEQTSMLDISNRMQVSQGLCYRYFASKEKIYAAALEQYVSEGTNAFRAVFCHSAQPLQARLASLPALHNMHENRGQPDFFNLPGNERFHTQMQIELCNRLYPIVVEELRQAQSKGEIALESPEATAAFCLYGQLGVWQLANTSAAEKAQATKTMLNKLIG